MRGHSRQTGVVLVFALLILMSLTVLGVSSVTSSLMQNKMAVSMENQSVAFDAAEAAIAGVVFESEDDAVLTDDNLFDPLSEARQGNVLNPGAQNLSCFDNGVWSDRAVTQAGLGSGAIHTATGNYKTQPAVTSWSRTAFVQEQACRGSSNVIGGSNISCHVFVIRGCGQLEGSRTVVANTLNASVFAPASSN